MSIGEIIIFALPLFAAFVILMEDKRIIQEKSGN